MTASFLSKKKLELTYKMFLVETALDTEGDRLKKQNGLLIWILLKRVVDCPINMGIVSDKSLSSGRLYGADYLTQSEPDQQY